MLAAEVFDRSVFSPTLSLSFSLPWHVDKSTSARKKTPPVGYQSIKFLEIHIVMYSSWCICVVPSPPSPT